MSGAKLTYFSSKTSNISLNHAISLVVSKVSIYFSSIDEANTTYFS